MDRITSCAWQRRKRCSKKALDSAGGRFPCGLKGIDPDNGGEFINWHLLEYTKKNNIEFTRGRPYQKNNNAHIEQKNWTHIRKVMGYRRYDTQEQVDLMNDIYRNELRLYKNFGSCLANI